MACKGTSGDYSCNGWRLLATRIRERDGNRCRGCNRGAPDVSLEVHHRTYGDPGQCGECYLTGVSDDDLITLCAGVDSCHEAITNVRRKARGPAMVVIGVTATPAVHQTSTRITADVVIELVAAPVPAGAVIRPKPFNLHGED